MEYFLSELDLIHPVLGMSQIEFSDFYSWESIVFRGPPLENKGSPLRSYKPTRCLKARKKLKMFLSQPVWWYFCKRILQNCHFLTYLLHQRQNFIESVSRFCPSTRSKTISVEVKDRCSPWGMFFVESFPLSYSVSYTNAISNDKLHSYVLFN